MNEKEFEKSLENSVVISLDKYNEFVEAKTKLDLIRNAIKEDTSSMGLSMTTDSIIKMIVND